MCTEFILALIYLFTIVIVNFFLSKLLINYFKTILTLIKIKTIFNCYKNENLSFLTLLFLYQQDNEKYKKVPKSLSKLGNLFQDILLLGNIYRYLFTNSSKNIKNSFFELLSTQYFPIP